MKKTGISYRSDDFAFAASVLKMETSFRHSRESDC